MASAAWRCGRVQAVDAFRLWKRLQTDADARICLAFKRQQEILTEQMQEARARGDAREEERVRQLLRRVQDNELSYHQSRMADLAARVLADRAPAGLIRTDLPKLAEPERAVLERALTALAALRPALTAAEHFARGNAFHAAQDYEKALAQYNAALALRPDDPATLHNRGAVLHELKRYQEALPDYNRSLELRPDDPNTLSTRGVTLDDLERYEQALADYNRSLELQRDDPATLNLHGGTLCHMNRYEEALADCSRSLELRPDHPATLSNRATALRHLKRCEEALAGCNRSLELRPDHPGTLNNRACVLSLTGRYEEAFADLREAIAGDGKYRRVAREDEDFEGLRNDPHWGPRFKELVETED